MPKIPIIKPYKKGLTSKADRLTLPIIPAIKENSIPISRKKKNTFLGKIPSKL